MPDVPVIASANLQALLDSYENASIPNKIEQLSKPVLVAETGEPAYMVLDNDGNRVLLGPEFILLNYGSTTALTSSATLCQVLLPFAPVIRITAVEVAYRIDTTNTGTHFWSFDLQSEGTNQIITHASDEEAADVWNTYSNYSGMPDLDGPRSLDLIVAKHSSPGALDIIAQVRGRKVLATTA